MRLNAHTTFAALALLASGSNPWACEPRDVVDDGRSGMAAEVPQSLSQGNKDAAATNVQPWYEICRDISEPPQDGGGDDMGEPSRRREPRGGNDAGRDGVSDGSEHALRRAGARATFVVPPSAAYGLLTLGYTRGPSCGLAKIYLDDRFIETISLRGPSPSVRCERIYYLEDPSAEEHRLEARVANRPVDGKDAYGCLDYVVADW